MALKIEQELDINVVFVGYEEGGGAMDVNPSTFQAGLSETYRYFQDLLRK